MTNELAFERLREANPVPEPGSLEQVTSDRDVLLALVMERTETMQTQEHEKVATAPRRPNGWLIAAAAAAAIVVTVGLINLIDQPAETVATTVPVEDEANPLPVLDQWVDAMNQGDLDGALAVLSPEASCDLPFGGLDTCEDHLGYLVEIGTHFEQLSCRESSPYRCSFDLTSELHAVMGYPDYTLPMNPTFTLDDDGLLIADFFGNIPVSKPYIPSEAVDIWGYMQPKYPDLNIGPQFGPDPYTAQVGVAVMEAAREINDPDRVVEQTLNPLSRFSPAGIRTCSTQDGDLQCRDLLEFLEAIGSQLTFECDTASIVDDTISCVVTVDSEIHRTLGSGPSSSEMSLEYAGGRAQRMSMTVLFSADPVVHEAFIEYVRAGGDPALVNNGRLRLNADNGPLWVAAAEDFAATR
jgi:hypothetical protein